MPLSSVTVPFGHLRSQFQGKKVHQIFILLSAVALFLLACLSPGPVWAVITSTAIAASRKAAVITGVGVAAATLTWATVTMLGFGSLVASFYWFHTVLRLAGAIYLIWIGIKMLMSAYKNKPFSINQTSDIARHGIWGAFRRGYITSLTNPKAAAFFGSIFVVVLPPDFPVAMQVATVLALSVASAAWHCSLALVFSTAMVQAGYGRAKPKIDAVIGVVLVTFGTRLALSR